MPYKFSADISTANKHDLELIQPSLRILHVVGGMNRGGIETWLMHVLRHINRYRFQIDFLVHTTETGAYDQEIRTLGSRVISCPPTVQPWLYARNFQRILHEYGPYDIVHSHVHHFSGNVLRLASQSGVPSCIAHCHTDTSTIEAKAGWKKRFYIALMKHWISRYATIGLACSHNAATNLFGISWKNDPRWQTFYCGVDLKPFQALINSVNVRAEFGIPADAFVIGHVGRFVEIKNHAFILKLVAEIAQREPRTRLLLLGDGSLRPDIQQQVLRQGLTDHVIFAGVRTDVTRLMLGAMNTFILPSFYEGLPLVLLEAQAAGLPCFFSDVITEEVEIVKPLVQRLSLSQPVSVWADAILTTKDAGLRITQPEALRLVQQSAFNIQTCVKDLENLYLQQSQTYCHSRL